MAQGIVIREAVIDDAPGVAQVHAETWGTAYSGILPADVIAERSYEQRLPYWRSTLGQPGAETLYVAARNGEIVCFASGGPERTSDPLYRGELYVMDTCQGQGSVAGLRQPSYGTWSLMASRACSFRCSPTTLPGTSMPTWVERSSASGQLLSANNRNRGRLRVEGHP